MNLPGQVVEVDAVQMPAMIVHIVFASLFSIRWDIDATNHLIFNRLSRRTVEIFIRQRI